MGHHKTNRPAAAQQNDLLERWELPTWAVVIVTYGGFGLLTWHAGALPWWVLLPLGGYLVCLQGSLQHETIHGHPTRWRWLNALIGLPAFSLWMPYLIYRDMHRAHHRTGELTSPLDDPESFYLTPARWRALGPLRRGYYRMLNTAAGRLLVGPAHVAGTFWWQEARRLLRGDLTNVPHWLLHGAVWLLLGYWLFAVCRLSPVAYVALFAYPGLSLTLLRSFAEHRPAADPAHRTAIVEAGPLMSLLYLNNNLHSVHHNAPEAPWYRLRAIYRGDRAAILAGNGGYLFHGYFGVLRRFLLRVKDSPEYPGTIQRA
jgi:fatty acid desaturase